MKILFTLIKFRNLYRVFKSFLSEISTAATVRFKGLKQLSYFSLVDSSKFQAFSNHFPYNLTNSVCQQFQDVFEQNKLINELSVIYTNNQFRNLKVSEMYHRISGTEFFMPQTNKKLFKEHNVPISVNIPCAFVYRKRTFISALSKERFF
jgi:hypothetical protein